MLPDFGKIMVKQLLYLSDLLLMSDKQNVCLYELNQILKCADLIQDSVRVNIEILQI